MLDIPNFCLTDICYRRAIKYPNFCYTHNYCKNCHTLKIYTSRYPERITANENYIPDNSISNCIWKKKKFHSFTKTYHGRMIDIRRSENLALDLLHWDIQLSSYHKMSKIWIPPLPYSYLFNFGSPVPVRKLKAEPRPSPTITFITCPHKNSKCDFIVL